MSRKRHGATKKPARKRGATQVHGTSPWLRRWMKDQSATSVTFPIPGATYHENHPAPPHRLTQAALPRETSETFFYNPLVSLQDSVESTLLRKLAKKDGEKTP